MIRHTMGVVQNFENSAKRYSGKIGRCECHGEVLMFFTPFDGTSILSDDKNTWPWDKATQEWSNYWEKSRKEQAG
jgi:hypothetical protein